MVLVALPHDIIELENDNVTPPPPLASAPTSAPLLPRPGMLGVPARASSTLQDIERDFTNTSTNTDHGDSMLDRLYSRIDELSSAKLLEDQNATLLIGLIPRGQIRIKGKGMGIMSTFWVTSENHSSAKRDRSPTVQGGRKQLQQILSCTAMPGLL